MSGRTLHDRVVVITGAAGGLGSSLARHCADAGATVAVLDLDGARAQALAAELRQRSGRPALALACDITDRAAAHDAVAAIVRECGRIDWLVNNAGISARCLLRDAAPEVLERVMAVNLFGAAHVTAAALPALTAQRGQIVVISSIAGFAPLVGRTAYAASKHALHGFFDSLRSELHGAGVGVMLACPAFIATGIERAALGADGRPAGAARRTSGREVPPDAVAARIVADALRGRRLCLPSALSRTAWWLSRLAPALYERQMLRRQGGEFEL
ncbi:MAG: SDR family oxidoreductase [Ideonella sp.]|nr:SDR family oxidoreductase [Ideonella sp.]MCC7455586.1 SDR family oxidoreductase [Nitrospira sp.]